jgi:glycosyltransferase involved in cell wall biosynthesis
VADTESSAAAEDRPSLSATVSVKGRFHAFDLARQLVKHGALRQLITSYPRFKVREWGIPNAGVRNFLRVELMDRIASRVPVSEETRRGMQIEIAKYYDRVASKKIPKDTKIFVGWSSTMVAQLRAAKALGAKTVVERGSTHILFHDRILREEYQRLGLRWSGIHPETIDRELLEYEEADFIAVPTGFVLDTFIRHGVPRGKILVNPYGCNLSVFGPRPKKDGVFRVIHCGHISVQKGAHLLIRAFAELNLPNSELWLIGALSPEIREVLTKYSGYPISVKGPFPQSSLPDYYSQGSVFCLASLQEGLAMVLPQALSCGLPVIATENSGARDVVAEGETGFVVPAGDVAALKEKIELLYSQPALRDQMANNTLAGARDLSWDRYGRDTVANYRRVLGQ